MKIDILTNSLEYVGFNLFDVIIQQGKETVVMTPKVMNADLNNDRSKA